MAHEDRDVTNIYCRRRAALGAYSGNREGWRGFTIEAAIITQTVFGEPCCLAAMLGAAMCRWSISGSGAAATVAIA